ncbi:MAG: porin [Pirellulales bacterium]|nr:porin [Pirellulales bacterium]
MSARTTCCFLLLLGLLVPSVWADEGPTLAPEGPAMNALQKLTQQKEAAVATLGDVALDESVTTNAGCDSCSGDGCGCATECCDLWRDADLWRRGQFYIQSWLSQGFTWNPADPASRVNSYVTFNDRANEYMMNQLYVIMGRRPNTEGCTWDWGGRVDLLYGTDYFFTTALGLETRRSDGSQRWNTNNGTRNNGNASIYGLAMPQLYAELYAPMGYGTTFKFGHFYTIMGYESVMAPENFFYSHSYVMQYGEPFTHTGMLASYRYTPRTTIHAGFTRGWDTWEDPNQTMAFLGGLSWVSCDRQTTLNFTLHTGNEDHAGEHNRTSYSLVFSRKLSPRTTYVFQHDLGIQNDGAVTARATVTDAYWYGINQYLFYQCSEKTALGFRFEWFRDEENARLLGGALHPALQGGNVFAATLGMNWKPCARTTIRPEVRWDWSDVESRPGGNLNGLYDDFRKKNQFNLAVDMVVVF